MSSKRQARRELAKIAAWTTMLVLAVGLIGEGIQRRDEIVAEFYRLSYEFPVGN